MADIVIRGVDMPKGDLEYVSLWVYGDGRVYVSNQASATSSQRLQDLVILLPEGHGKLGDLDALWESYWRSTNEEVNVGSLISCTDVIIPAEGD